MEHVCKLCNAGFKYESELVRHNAIAHTSVKPFQCEFCDLGFNWKSNLTRHQKTQHSGCRPFPCEDCDRRFYTKRQLKHHMKSHSEVVGDDPQEEKGKYSRSLKKLMSPPSKRSDPKDESSTKSGSDSPVKFLRSLPQAYRYDDDESGDDRYASSDDDVMRLAIEKSRVDQAMKSSDQVFRRTDDDERTMTNQTESGATKRRGRKRKSFALGKDPTLVTIKQEVDDDDEGFAKSPVPKKRGRKPKDKTHEGEYSNVVVSDDDERKRVGSFSSVFNEDISDQEDEGPFTPRQSAKTLNRLSLKRNQQTYRCSFCDRVFSRLSSHLQHERSHLRKPVSCNVCGKRFERQSVLDRHGLIHKKTYKCGFCQQWFARKSALMRHVYVHGLGESPDDYQSSLPSTIISDSPMATILTLEDTESGNDSDYQLGSRKIDLQGVSGSHTYNTRFASKLESCKSEVLSGPESCEDPAKFPSDGSGVKAESSEKDSCKIKDEVPSEETKDLNFPQSEGKGLKATEKPGDGLKQCAKNLMIIRLLSKNKDIVRLNEIKVESEEVADSEEKFASVTLSGTRQIDALEHKVSIPTAVKMEDTAEHSVAEPLSSVGDMKSRIRESVLKKSLSGTGQIDDLEHKDVSVSTSVKMEETIENAVAESLSSAEDTNNHIKESVSKESRGETERLVDPNCGNSDEVAEDGNSHSSLEKHDEDARENTEGSIPVDEIKQKELPALNSNNSVEIDDEMNNDEVGAPQTLKEEEQASENNVDYSPVTTIGNQDAECNSMDEMRTKDEFEDLKSCDSPEEDGFYETVEETCMHLVSKIADEQDVENILIDVNNMMNKIMESVLILAESTKNELGDSNGNNEVKMEESVRIEENVEDCDTCKEEAHKGKESENPVGPLNYDVKEDTKELPETDLKDFKKTTDNGDSNVTDAPSMELPEADSKDFKKTTDNEDSNVTDTPVVEANADTDLELDQITPSLVQTLEEAKQNETIYDDLELVKFDEIETEELKSYDDAIRKSDLIKSCEDFEAKAREGLFTSENDGDCEMESVSPLLSSSALKQGENDDEIYMELESLETSRNGEVDADEKELGEKIIDLGEDGCKETEKEDDLQDISSLLTGNLDHDLMTAGFASNMIQCEEVSTTDGAVPDEDPSHQASGTSKDRAENVVIETDKGADEKTTEFPTVQGPSKGDDESVRPPDPDANPVPASDFFPCPSKRYVPKSKQVKKGPPKKRGPKPGSSRKRKRREVDNLLNPFDSISIEDGDFGRARKKFLRSGSLFNKGEAKKSDFIDTLSIKSEEDRRFPIYEKISIRQNIMVEQFIEREGNQFPFGSGLHQRKDPRMVHNPRRLPFNSLAPPSFTDLLKVKTPLPGFNTLRDWKAPPPKPEEKDLQVPQEIRNSGSVGTGFNALRKQPDPSGSIQFDCNRCDRSFKRKEDMIRHRFTEHEKNCF